MEGPADPEERIEAICASISRFASYEPECVLCLSGPLAGRTDAEGRAIVVEGLRRAADVAREAAVRLGFEPVHPAQHETAGFVTSLEDALALLAEARAGDVGIMADTFNLGHEDAAAIVAAAPRFTGVHVADELPEPVPGVRALPSADGRSAELVRALRAAGWDGTLDVEVFSTPDGFWALSVEEAARRAFTAASSLLR
jgi:sugar phosphate isomerase/epimerase